MVQEETKAAHGVVVVVAVEIVVLPQPLVVLEAGIAGSKEGEVVGEEHQSVAVVVANHSV